MAVLLSLLVGVLVGSGVYMMLRRSIVKLIIGLSLLSHGVNLLIFTVGGLERGDPPLIAEGAKTLTGQYADPLPQALILTAIVIGFGLQAFALVLVKAVYRSIGTDDLDQLRTTDS